MKNQAYRPMKIFKNYAMKWNEEEMVISKYKFTS